MRSEIRSAAEPLRDEWQRLMLPLSPRSAAGYRIYVRRTGVVSVEQSIGRTTGRRGDWAKPQLRRGREAVEESAPDVLERFESALDRISSVIA